MTERKSLLELPVPMEQLEVETPYDSSESDDEHHGSITNASHLADSTLSVGSKSLAHKPKLTFGDAVALLISLQIGSGIFSSPSQVSKHTPGPGFALVVWLLSGLLAWAGAACYAELGTALPVSGGTQEYLKYIFGDGLAFLASWIWILGVKASGMAALTIIATQYWLNFVLDSNALDDSWQCKAIAMSVLAVIVSINMLSINVTRAINKFMSILKLLTLVLLFVLSLFAIVAGLHIGHKPLGRDWTQKNWFSTTNPAWSPGIWSGMGEYTLAIYAGLWAFSGWDNVNMVTGDLQNAGRNLPRAIHTSQPIVIVSFICANICYYLTIPWAEVDSDDAIAFTLGQIILGRAGSLVFTILVSVACLGSVSANVFTSSRLVVSAARAGWLPRSLGKFNTISLDRLYRSRIQLNSHATTTTSVTLQPPDQTPLRAMLFMMCLVSIYMMIGTFASLITFIGLAEYVFFAAATAGLLVMRIREPQLPRPYKPTILVPIVFSCVSISLVLVGITKAPAQAALLGVLLTAGFATKWKITRSLWECVSRRSKNSDRGTYESLSRHSPNRYQASG